MSSSFSLSIVGLSKTGGLRVAIAVPAVEYPWHLARMVGTAAGMRDCHGYAADSLTAARPSKVPDLDAARGIMSRFSGGSGRRTRFDICTRRILGPKRIACDGNRSLSRRAYQVEFARYTYIYSVIGQSNRGVSVIIISFQYACEKRCK